MKREFDIESPCDMCRYCYSDGCGDSYCFCDNPNFYRISYFEDCNEFEFANIDDEDEIEEDIVPTEPIECPVCGGDAIWEGTEYECPQCGWCGRHG